MITETSAVTVRQNLGEMLNLVQYRHDSVVINKDGGLLLPWLTPVSSSAFVACRGDSTRCASGLRRGIPACPRPKSSNRRSPTNNCSGI